ncbi:DUF423 domain-containing protein [Desulfofustis glycolicus]|uniref:Uncharacterized membrane protein YgdD, TMEM256/DUF423 family n=1 Tax=Desulfofustis glycolicus DSM 9705 TaxID=1121409 RepID=A0A1M5WJ10_9BACT|nr:DUF423 domain-containing protein [Desulfofustis glycolicus]MCB2216823.1 DUF423 domain-containing protein [Desulfobulbaceae bacterium]SHH87407.1 Uncharacterized membrane protein YgdD, TMEM256/DUF423 family [Desulfofustis glycolicus DSM 9705]
MTQLFFRTGALLAALSVAMGAYAAHGGSFDEIRSLWLEKAVRYQMYHALALILTALVCGRTEPASGATVLAGWCFIGGIALFSGSLYVMAFSSVSAGLITPLGGLLFLAGWLLLGWNGLGSR